MLKTSLLKNVFLLAVGPAIFATCIAGAVEQAAEPMPSASPVRLDGGSLALEAREQGAVLSGFGKTAWGLQYDVNRRAL